VTTTIEAIYENGRIVPPKRLPLSEKARVRVTIESGDTEREAWLKLSEQSLTKTRDNADDDVFNELAAMAGDPQIQRELRAINSEFAAAESDGLGKI